MMRRWFGVMGFAFALMLMLAVPVWAQTDNLPVITPDNVHQLALLKTIPYPAPIHDLNETRYFATAFSPDDTQIALGQRGKLTLVNVTDSTVAAEVGEGINEIPDKLYFSEDGTQLIAIDGDHFCVWDIPANLITFCESPGVHTPGNYEYAPVGAAAFNADSTQLFVISTQSSIQGVLVHVYDLKQMREVDRLQIDCRDGPTNPALFDRLATHLICTFGSEIRLYNTADLTAQPRIISTGYIRWSALSVDGKRLFTAQLTANRTDAQAYTVIYDAATGDVITSGDLVNSEVTAAFAGDRMGVFRYDVRDGLLDGQSGEVVFRPLMEPAHNRFQMLFNSSGTLAVILPLIGEGFQLYGVVDCTATTTRDINLRESPSTATAVKKVFVVGERLALIDQMTVDGFTWWQTGDGLWMREDVVDVDCPVSP